MKDIEYIYEIYKQGSFSGASRTLFISQPALSLTVKKTEEALGITIFDRSSTPLKLTEEGRVYIDGIEAILSTDREIKKKLEDMSDLKSGKIIVSGENFVASFIMPSIIMNFSKKYPGIDVEIVENNSPDLKKQLLSEGIDLLISHTFDKNLYDSRLLFHEDLLLAVPPSFEINKKLKDFVLSSETIKDKNMLKKAPSVKLSDFKDEEFLLLKPGNDMGERSRFLFSQENIEPKVRIYLDQLITSFNLASAGMGIAFVTNALVNEVGAKNLCFYRLDGEYSTRAMYIGWKRNRYLSKACSAFIKTSVEEYKRML